MKKIVLVFTFLSIIIISFGQNLYIKTFGDNKLKSIIFLHGGPGYNCASFEGTTAQRLADSGFFVIVYDRRGEGRSSDSDVKFTFEQTFNDLNTIYKRYSIKKASLIGHSFGGIVATLFAEKYSERVNSIFLISAPVSLQETFKNIINLSNEIYKAKNDSANLNYIKQVENMDTTSLEYSGYCFTQAMQNGFYSPKRPTGEMKNIYAAFKKDTLAKYVSQMTNQAPQGFWKNEHYTTINLTNSIKELLKKKIKIYGLYGKDDGLFSEQQVANLAAILGEANLKYLDNCSHNVFRDRQTTFINSLKTWTK